MSESSLFAWEHCTVEWLWMEGSIRVNLPGIEESSQDGSYQEVVELLSELGHQGWEVVTCVGVSNWLFWTLKRQFMG